MNAPDFFEALALADSAAQHFVSLYPKREDNPAVRSHFRAYSVPGLRWLWRNGDASTRTTIAARIAVWREVPQEQISRLQLRILGRENNRLGGAR